MDSTLERAAELLARARLPVFGGLFTDIEGATAAISVAVAVLALVVGVRIYKRISGAA